MALSLALMMGLLAWGPSLLARDFSFDDSEIIHGNPVVQAKLPATDAFRRGFWFHLGSAGQYRPWATLSLRADWARNGNWVVGYHGSNLIGHLLVVALAGLLVLLQCKRPRPLLLGLALFAAHPALADSVAWISGRSSMLGVIGPLLGGICIALSSRVGTRSLALALVALGSSAGLLCGLLGKEEAILFAPFFVLLAGSRSRSGGFAACLGCGVGLTVYLGLHAQALGHVLPQAPMASLGAAPLEKRLLVSGRAFLEGLRLIFAPVSYPPNYRAAKGFGPDSPPASWAWFGWLAFAALTLLALRMLQRAGRRPGGQAHSQRLAAIGLLFGLAAFLPYSQIIPAGEVFAGRFLYLPLLFSSAFTGFFLIRLPKPIVTVLLAAAVLGAWSAKAPYNDREAYAQAILKSVPHDAGAWNDLGLALEEQGDLEGAAAAWQRGLAVDPHQSRIWSNLGRHQIAAGDLDAAETSLRRAVLYSQRNALARCNLGSLLLRRKAPKEAAKTYAQATQLAPGMVAAWRGLANAQMRLGNLSACAQALSRALSLDPSDQLSLALEARLAQLR